MGNADAGEAAGEVQVGEKCLAFLVERVVATALALANQPALRPATLIRPDAGRATVGGYDVVRQAHQVRRLIGLTGQYASVDETLTGAENLTLIGRLLGQPRTEAKRRARNLCRAKGR